MNHQMLFEKLIGHCCHVISEYPNGVIQVADMQVKAIPGSMITGDNNTIIIPWQAAVIEALGEEDFKISIGENMRFFITILD